MSSPENVIATGPAAVLHHLGICLRTAAIYDLSNSLVETPIANLVNSINRTSRDGGTVAVQAVHDKFFLNKKFVRLDSASFEQLKPLLQIFRRLTINEIAFSAERLEVRHIREFLTSFKRCMPTSDPASILKEQFEAVAVRVIDGTEADAFDVAASPQYKVLRQYALLVVYLRRVCEALREGVPTRLSGLRRMLQSLSDASEGHESLLVTISALDQFASHPQAHQVRCAAFALLIGRRLGLGRAALIDLALAALFHDVARDQLDAESAATALDSTMRGSGGAAVRRMALRSMLTMCRSGVGLDSHLRVAVAREVWLPLRSSPSPSLPARIIAVLCAFDLLTRPPVSRRGLTPDHALRIIQAKSGTRFDPRAVTVFSHAIGVYPAGTVLDLSDGSVAIVREGVTPTGPRIQVVRRGTTAPPDGRISIANAADPRSRGVNPISLIMS